MNMNIVCTKDDVSTKFRGLKTNTINERTTDLILINSVLDEEIFIIMSSTAMQANMEFSMK